MQPRTPRSRLARMARILLAAAIALGVAILPVRSAVACSCAMPGTPAEAVAASSLAFVGTAVDAVPAPRMPDDFGPTTRYAFEVERASQPLDAEMVEVRSLASDGGSCGFSFGLGERWFVVTHLQDGTLQTNLCSGNLPIDGMAAADLASIVEVLPHAPAPGPVDGSTPGGGEAPFPFGLALAGLAMVGAAAAALVAFRRSDPVSRG